MNAYRCETCKHFKNEEWGMQCYLDPNTYGFGLTQFMISFIDKRGCASHSDRRCIPISNNKMCEMCSKNEREDERQKLVSALIERTKNFGEIKHPDGSSTFQMKLDVKGSVNNAIRSVGDYGYKDGCDSWGVKEFCRLYHEGRKAWLEGDLETVADMFGILV